MNKGLIIKEWYAFKKIAKQMIILLVFFSGMAMYSGKDMLITYISTMIMVLGITINVNSMAEDEKSNWNTYGLTLPVSRTEIVRVRYLFVLALIAASILYMIFIYSGMYLLHGIDITGGIVATGTVIILILTAHSLLIPIMFKVGTSKARVYMFFVLGIPLAAFILVINYVTDEQLKMIVSSIKKIDYLAQAGKVIIPLICLGILYISYRVSMSIFRKKEFA